MDTPRVDAEPFMTLQLKLHRVPIGRTPFGDRVEVDFAGTAVSTLWTGERHVTGIDHITFGSNGIARIDVHVTIAGDGEVVTYRGHGRGGAHGVVEGVTFDTACERLSWLNESVAIGRGAVSCDDLTIWLYLVRP